MNIKRLNILADHLERIEDDSVRIFDMRTWWDDEVRPLKCYTAACAIGEATTIPEFKMLGLRIGRIINEVALDTINPRNYIGRNGPIYNNYSGWEAVDIFFDLDEDSSIELFSGHGYDCDPVDVTPTMVAYRIRLMVRDAVKPMIEDVEVDCA